MTFDFFSPTQLKALSWWSDASPYRELDAVICDGAVCRNYMESSATDGFFP